MIQEIDGIEYKLRAPFDMSFIHEFGKVFKIYDDQDSGNICFGVTDRKLKYFVKFAGAPTAEYQGTQDDAVRRLMGCEPVYQNLKHENLITYRFSKETGGGFAMIFDWVDAECMGKQYPESREKFMRLSQADRLKVFEDVLCFLIYVAGQGYAAVDFYDGSILYDFINDKTVVCDIDFFQKRPFINNMGRLWGSSRFMSPEEFTLGAPIDEITNVYLAGALAFAFFGGEKDRSRNLWLLPEKAYQTALKAVSENRQERFASLASFYQQWKDSLR